MARREKYALIRSKIEHSLANVNVDLYNKPCTHPASLKRFILLQQSHKSLIIKFKQYQGHVSQYEKTFALYQVVKFVKAFKFEIENILQNKSKINRWYNNSDLKDDLRCFIVRSTSIVENLGEVHKRFVNLDKSYSNSEYTQHIVALYNGLFQVAQTLYHTLYK